MTELKLYHLPGACSRVTMTALEQAGVSYDDELVDIMTGQQHTPEYRAVNPRGKVPALVVDGKLLSESGAILWWLHQTFPAAGLLPQADDNWSEAQILSDLFWISAGWHPAVRANMMPIRWTTGDPAPVRERGKQLVKPLFEVLDARLADQPWWFGDGWSIIDVYAYWQYTTAEMGEYDLAGLDHLADHRRRVEAHPAFQRALAREQAALNRGQTVGA